MKSISTLARELKVSPQAVYKKVNNQLSTKLKGHVHKENGKTVIDEDGEKIIRESFIQSVDNEFNSVENQANQLIQVLQQQLAAKDQQIENLLQKLENMQILLKGSQQQNQLLIESKNPKKTLFQRLFGANE